MIAKRMFMRVVSVIITILLITPVGGISTASGQQASGGKYSKDELAQMVAPIALYPDSLLSQVLMASTYPLEIVEADRWVKKNKKLKGDSLGNALKNKTWDASTKSLCYYPEVLSMLSEKLEWTTKLGNAFLNQQAEVMNAAQELRAKAQAQGNLTSNSQQKVVVQEKYIVIEPASPGVVYVPAYNPAVVYGVWAYPAYPPYPYYYPGAVVAGAAVSFGVGFAVGAAVAGWSGCHWGGGTVNVNVNKTANFNNSANINHYNQYNKGNNWQHNPQNRQGVAYNNKATAQKYGQSPSRTQQASRDARGYGQPQSKQGQSMKQSTARQPQAQQRGTSQSAFSGAGNKQSERAAASRGQQSRSAGGFDRGSSRGGGSVGAGGGGSRGGGMRGGGRRR